MGQIGCLGDIPFEVSAEKILTPSSMKWSGSARYATHNLAGGNSLTEFLGNNPDKFTMKILLSAFLGVDPMECAQKLLTYRRQGAALPLIIGEKAYGRYRWNIVSHDIELKRTDGVGNVIEMTVNLTLQEYLREGGAL